MNLKNLNLEDVYTSRGNLHLINDFLIPCLSNSNRYDRLTGYFSSNLLFIIFEGIKKFIDNGGVIRLLLGTMPREEIDVLNDEIICNNLLKDFYDDLNNIDKLENGEHLKLLAWMVKNKRISVKIAIILNENKKIANKEEIIKAYRNGIMHQKIGIFYDSAGNIVTFSGSVNETYSGWVKNSEEFKVFPSWKDSKVWLSDCHKFERYWRKKEPTLKIIKFPDKILNELEKNAPEKLKPETFEKIDAFCKEMRKSEEKTKSLPIYESDDWILKEDGKPKIETFKFWPHQSKAVLEWIKNGYTGIFKMATASGKTYTAIKCAYDLNLIEDNLLIIVLVPTKYLIEQWKDDVKTFSKNYFTISSEIKEDWKDIIAYFPETINLGHYFLISTVKSFYLNLADYLVKNRFFETMNILLISDEVHTAGQNKIMTKLLEIPKPKYLLGLSATPSRYFDDVGTDFIFSYFGKIIFRYSIKDGQNDNYLAKYYYYIFFCTFSETEYNKYQKFTQDMGRFRSDNEKSKQSFKDIATKRARVIKQCQSKLEVLNEILSDLKKKDRVFHSIIYGYKIDHLNEINGILRKHNLNGELFIGKTSTDLRKILLKNSDKEKLHSLLAVKCLNEGINLPSLNVGIIVSNSKNPIESIQRRGRLLRAPENKPDVIIIDFLVLPPEGYPRDKNLILNQLERIGYFIRESLNFDEQEQKIYNQTGFFIPDYEEI